MPGPVHYLPLLSTLVAALFAFVVLRRYADRGGLHLLWWGIGLVAYAAGTAMESYTTLFGWEAWSFRTWYIAGALLGGAPLAQGTVYLLVRNKRRAHVMAAGMMAFAAVAAVFVWLSPIDMARVEPHRLTGKVMEWSWVRLFSPFLNTYALVFLVGGAALSAWRFRAKGERHRFVGNALIALGALLPGIGGAFTRFGMTEALYVGELVGVLLIFAGYRVITRDTVPGRAADRVAAAAER